MEEREAQTMKGAFGIPLGFFSSERANLGGIMGVSNEWR